MWLKHCILVAIIIVIMEIKLSKCKGPHHPRGSHIIKRETRKQEFNEHLNHKDQE